MIGLMTLGWLVLAFLAGAVLQVAADNPVLVLVLAVLAFAGVTSVLTSVIRKVADATGIKPQQQLYGISLLLTALTVVVGGGSLPGFGASPAETVAMWLAWATVNAGIAAFWYELLLKRIPVLGPPAPTT